MKVARQKMKDSKDEWEYELNNLILKNPWKYNRLLKPRLIILPSIFPSYYAATLMHIILIGDQLKNCPGYVRRYVLAHEYGHLYHKHTLHSYFYFICIIGAIASFFGPAWIIYIAAFICFILAIISKYKLLEKEYQADNYSVREYGVDSTIKGQKWMIVKTKTSDYPGRMARMSRLLKYKETKQWDKENVDSLHSPHTQSQIFS